MVELRLDRAAPATDLRPYVVGCYRLFCAEAFDLIERAAPAQLRFVLAGGPVEYRSCAGERWLASPCHLVGPTCAARHMSSVGALHLFGLELTAPGWAAIVGQDASGARGAVLEAGALVGAAGVARVQDVDDPAALADAAQDAVRALLGRRSAVAVAFAAIVDRWLASGPAPLLAALETATGLSRRQVERQCNRLYGFPPKLLARRQRALRVIAALAAGGDAAELALAGGFYDQSHMCREVKQFAGVTPRCINPARRARLHVIGG